MKQLGPHHKDDCDGSNFRFSGEGYNRVKVCACGAEDHAAEKGSFNFTTIVRKFLEEHYPEELKDN